MKTPINIVIEGNKELNTAIKETLKQILPALVFFLGKKIVKANNVLVKAADSLLPLIVKDEKGERSVGYITFAHGCMYINFKICKFGGSYDVRPSTAYTQYFERRVAIGQTVNDVLVSVEDYDKLVTEYDLDKVIDLDAELKKIAKLNEMQKELDAFKQTIDYTVREYYR